MAGGRFFQRGGAGSDKGKALEDLAKSTEAEARIAEAAAKIQAARDKIAAALSKQAADGSKGLKESDKLLSGIVAKVTGLSKDSAGALRAGGLGTTEAVKGVAGYASALKGVAGVATEVAGKIYDVFKEAFDQVGALVGNLNSFGRATGATTQEVQGLAFQAQRAGVDFASLQGTLVGIQARQYATKFSGDAILAFQRVGVSVRGANGRFKESTVVLDEMVEKLADLKDPAERTGRALAAGGQGLLDLANYAAAVGVEKFRAMRLEVKEFGAELSNEQVRDVSAYRFELSRLGLVAQGFRNTVAGPLYSALGPVAAQFAAWLKSVQGPLREGLGKAIDSLAKLAPFLLRIAQAGVGLLPAFGKLVIILGGIANAVGTVITAVIDGFDKLGPVGTTVGLVLFAAFFPLTALFAGIALLVEDLIVFSKGGRSAFGAAIDAFKNWLDDFSKPRENDHWLVQILREVAHYLRVELPKAWADFKALIGEPIKDLEKWFGPQGVFALTPFKTLSPEKGDKNASWTRALAGDYGLPAGRRDLSVSPWLARGAASTVAVSPYDPGSVEGVSAKDRAKFEATFNIVGARASEAKEIGEIAVKAVAEWFDDSILKQSGKQQ